jgi:hypothetical protein
MKYMDNEFREMFKSVPIVKFWEHCNTAMSIQDAVNPSGVAHALSKMWDDLMMCGLDTEAKRHYPPAVLIADKLQSLHNSGYSEAYAICKEAERSSVNNVI